MIPVRLQLLNFMSYGEGVPPLDLWGMRLVCLSGDNGNGKSALLDAMTWALFGKSRAKSDDDVIRVGAPECRVLFDFEVAGARYRIHRQRSRTKGAIWELQVFQEDGTPRTLSGNNANETRDRIKTLLRMDYDTFLATCYLAQGQADVFARSGPTDRKKILADILDLSRYDRLEAKAKDRQKAATEREGDADRILVQIDAELEREDEIAAQRADAAARRDTLDQSRTELQRAFETTLARCERLETDQRRADEWDERIAERRAHADALARESERLDKAIADAEAVASRRDAILAAVAEAEAVAERLQQLGDALAEAGTLQNRRDRLVATIRDQREQLDRERYRIDRDIAQTEANLNDRQQLDAEIARYDAEIAGFGDLAHLREQMEARRDLLAETLQGQKARRDADQSRRDALLKRRDALADSEDPECAYCGQPLTPAARQASLDAAEREIAAIEVDMAAVADDARGTRKALDTTRAEILKLAEQERLVANMDARRSHAHQERARLDGLETNLPDMRRHADYLTLQIDREEFALDERAELARVDKALQAIEQDRQEIQRLATLQARFRNAGQDAAHLEQAERILAEAPPRRQSLCADIQEEEKRIGIAVQRVAALRQTLVDLPALQRERADDEARLRTADAEVQRLERLLGELDGRLQRLAERKVERAKWEAERVAAAREKDVYRDLTAAFGKKGVQALLIETALPEIETEANALLHRMTSGALSLRLQTQREARTRGGGAIETLEIILADDIGTRPFEMYSGGEAFRVSLALRVALSKTLARRAGAPLQTLILDEGFGTQDPRGREAIAEALETISEDFALILVITHVEELKDRFPSRIEVVKNAAGSTFTVME